MTTSAQMSRQRSLEQQRAKAAWSAIQAVKDTGFAKEYRSLAVGAPADIQANGLGQTLAFWRAKGYEDGRPKKQGANEHYQLLVHVAGWVSAQLHTGNADALLDWVIKDAMTNDYRRATAEAITFLGWVKRFAEAELPSGGGQ